ncbi:uncharacterized protein N7506_000345, partial [Penicillium brevicompactum]|uniref:uncharacterized protein n=1 Tax=Penicillium brevicompactum TaxID=5074 RepID=UPI002540165D
RPVNCRHCDLQCPYNGHVRFRNAQPLNVQSERNYNFGPIKLSGMIAMLSGRPDYSASCLKGSRAMIQLPSCWVKWVRGLYYVDFVFTKLIYMIGYFHQERKK